MFLKGCITDHFCKMSGTGTGQAIGTKTLDVIASKVEIDRRSEHGPIPLNRP